MIQEIRNSVIFRTSWNIPFNMAFFEKMCENAKKAPEHAERGAKIPKKQVFWG